MRRIFSTVFGPQDPALTVGSLAISATVRPAMVPRPVTTPSAPRPSASQLASSASSENEPSSSSRCTRSRTGSLPCWADFSLWRSGPPAYARSKASATCWASVMRFETLVHGDANELRLGRKAGSIGSRGCVAFFARYARRKRHGPAPSPHPAPPYPAAVDVPPDPPLGRRVVAHAHHDLVLDAARGERRVAGAVGVRLGRQRLAWPEPRGHRAGAQQDQQQRPPVQRLAAERPRGDDEHDEVRHAEP